MDPLVELISTWQDYSKRFSIKPTFNEISEQIFDQINKVTKIIMTDALSRMVNEYSKALNADKENAPSFISGNDREKFKKDEAIKNKMKLLSEESSFISRTIYIL